MSSLFPLLYVTGAFTFALGTLHFFFPRLFDFRGAISLEGAPLKPFPLLVTRYQTSRQDISGLVWVMNHAASFALVTVGLADLAWPLWARSSFRLYIALWIALWWVLRGASQFYLGRRWGDWAVFIVFSGFALLHLVVGLWPEG
jgi:hypothetical protein